MPGESPFKKQWRECLEAHYMHVIRMQDKRTEPTLRKVMQNIGFSDAELQELYIRVTAHVDDMPADFTPDASLFAGVDVPPAVEEVAAPPIEDAATPSAEPVDEPEIIETADAAAEIELAEPEMDDDTPDEDVEPVHDDPEAPQQLSLF